MNIFVNCWRGEAPLWKAFWIVGFLIAIIINIILMVIFNLVAPDMDPITRSNWILLIMFPYNVFAAICIWRCGKNSAAIWSILSKILVVLGLLIGAISIFRFLSA